MKTRKTNFTIEAEEITKELNLLKFLAKPKATIPILSTVLITVGYYTVNLRASDLDTELSIDLETSNTNALNVTDRHAYAVNCKDLLAALKGIKGAVTFTTEEHVITADGETTGTLLIDTPAGTFSLETAAADSFPDAPEKPRNPRFNIDSEVLKQLIEKTQFAVTKEISRFTLSGIAFEFAKSAYGNSALRLIATDGHRLSLANQPDFVEANPEKYDKDLHLIPLDSIKQLIRLLPKRKDTEQVIINYSDENGTGTAHAAFEIGKRTLTTRKGAGTFPNYNAVMPKAPMFSANLENRDFLPLMETALRMADERTKSTVIQAHNNELHLHTGTKAKGFQGKITADFPEVNTIAVSLSSAYILDILKATKQKPRGIKESLLTFQWKDPHNVIMFTGNNELINYQFVVMPLRSKQKNGIIPEAEKAAKELEAAAA